MRVTHAAFLQALVLPKHGGFVGFFKDAGCHILEMHASLQPEAEIAALPSPAKPAPPAKSAPKAKKASDDVPGA